MHALHLSQLRCTKLDRSRAPPPPPSPLHRKEHTLTYLLAVRCSITMLRSAVHGAKVTQTGSAGIPLPYLSVLRETLHRLSQ